MLLRFGVENHKSIRDYQELSLIATTLRDNEDGLLQVGPNGNKQVASKALRAVPAVAVYGANAAGKSTLLDAIAFFVRSIKYSHSQGGAEGTPFEPCLLDGRGTNKPSRYDADIVIEDARYHYGFSLNGRVIVEEWLYSFPLDGRQTRTVLYHRKNADDPEFYFGKSLKGENKQISKLVRPNSLFLSAAAQNSHPLLSTIHRFFSDRITTRIAKDVSEFHLAQQLLAYFQQNESRRDEAIKFLAAADVGVLNIDFSQAPVGDQYHVFVKEFEEFLAKHFANPPRAPDAATQPMLIKLSHRGVEGKSFSIPLESESAGTVSLLQLIGPVFTHLHEGGVILLDELNSTLHPLVSRELIRLFCRRSTNPGGAQLVFTTHDTNLLAGGLLRRDQIWFVEKDGEGASVLYPLSEISVRATDNIERGYLTGRFGAVPFLATSIKEVFSEKTDLAEQ